ncbi:MAG: helix-turn-helix domain-containing protein [Myxococcales bacterium]|nr:helix-turn-helix domain-containing protein [Myxococcales bacterium]
MLRRYCELWRASRPSFLTVKEAAKVLSVCRATVYSLVDKKLVTHVKVLGAIRIERESLARYLSRGQ